MCINQVLRVRTLEGDRAIMEDGRRVRLGGVTGVKRGDFLEVYADIAFAKIDEQEAMIIQKTRLEGGISL